MRRAKQSTARAKKYLEIKRENWQIMGGGRVLHHLLLHASRRSLFSPSFRTTGRLHSFFTHNFKTLQFQKPRYHSSSNLLSFSPKRPISAVYHYPNRFLNTDSTKSSNYQENGTEENALRCNPCLFCFLLFFLIIFLVTCSSWSLNIQNDAFLDGIWSTYLCELWGTSKTTFSNIL